MPLKDKVVVITGASSGIGASLARAASQAGAHTVICARRKERLDAIANEIRGAGGSVLAITADISKREQATNFVNAAFERFGDVDILVNNAGRGHCASVEDTSPETLESIFAVNTFSLWHTAAAVLPAMKKRDSGHIITISSVAGTTGYPFDSAYVAAKHAAVGFHAALRSELLDYNIRATMICPDGVATDWSASTEGGNYAELFVAGMRRSREIAKERAMPLSPISRMISPDEAAAIILAAMLDSNSPADIFTHPGSLERAISTTRRREDIEREMTPLFIGMKQEYESKKSRE